MQNERLENGEYIPLSLTNSQTGSLLSEFESFLPVSFGKSRIAVRLFNFILIHVCGVRRGTTGGGCEGARSMGPKIRKCEHHLGN